MTCKLPAPFSSRFSAFYSFKPPSYIGTSVPPFLNHFQTLKLNLYQKISKFFLPSFDKNMSITGQSNLEPRQSQLHDIPLLESFRHFAITDNPTSVHNTYTVIDRLPATDAFYRREKNSRMHINVPSTSTMMDTSRAWFVYAGKIKVRYFFNRQRINQKNHIVLLQTN